MVYCTDIEAFTTYVIGERDIEVEDIQVNIDDGQQVDKVVFNLLNTLYVLGNSLVNHLHTKILMMH